MLISSPDLIEGTVAKAGQINALKAVILGLLNGNIDAQNLADGAVTAAKLGEGAITTDKLPDGAVTAVKIADGAVGPAKMEPTTSVITSATTITPDRKIYIVSALAANATIDVPSFTPTDGSTLIIRIKDNGTSRTLTFNAIYRAVGVTLPTATTAGKELYIGAVYNATATKWDIISIGRQA